MATMRILLADDHPVLRKGLRALLSNEPDMAVVGEATTGDEAQELAGRLRPDIVLLDLSMPGPPAADTVRSLHASSPATRVVILTAYQDVATVRELINLGVGGYVLKDDDPELLVRAIIRVGQGGAWFSRRVLASLAEQPQRRLAGSEMPDLTDREREVLQLVKRGLGNKQIAAELHLQVQTVSNYLHTLYPKIGVGSRAEAVAWTYDHDIGYG